MPVAKAIALAYVSPTSSDPARPGPDVAATASRSFHPSPARSIASRTTGTIERRCSRDASSGTTPPYFPCTENWLATTDDRTRVSSSITDAAVSSHELSMARIVVTAGPGTLNLIRPGDRFLPVPPGLVHLPANHRQRCRIQNLRHCVPYLADHHPRAARLNVDALLALA